MISLVIAGSRTLHPSIADIDREIRKIEGLAFDPSQPIETEAALVISEVVCGAANGADNAGAVWAITRGINVYYDPVTDEDYRKWGRYIAPKVRNARMADRGDIGLVWWDGKSSGSCDFVTRMVLRRKRVEIVPVKQAVGRVRSRSR